MFLVLSKLIGVFVSASNLLVLLVIAGAVALLLRRRRVGKALIWTSALVFLAVGFGPLDSILMRPLEDRFPRPSGDLPDPTGIIVLGGVINPLTSTTREAIALTEDSERLSEAAALAHRYPAARLVFSGGTLGSEDERTSEASIAKSFFVGLGVDPSRIVLETRSLSTAENAAFTRDLLMPQSGERWLLVTSASHMPRAMGSFRHAGFPVIPYPVAYTTSGRSSDYWLIQPNVVSSFARADVAVHEWTGLFAYWLTGRTNELFPGREPHKLTEQEPSR
jgi:uncharacterized SAM-binding protein YcdF (DUF218 family)